MLGMLCIIHLSQFLTVKIKLQCLSDYFLSLRACYLNSSQKVKYYILYF